MGQHRASVGSLEQTICIKHSYSIFYSFCNATQLAKKGFSARLAHEWELSVLPSENEGVNDAKDDSYMDKLGIPAL